MAADALKLGKYQIRGTLGKGAMGIVYDGFDPVIERRVAIKTIARAAMDPREAVELLGRFKREAQAAGRLNHPSIVSIHDYGEEDGLAFIAMEFVQGQDLQKYVDSQERFDLQHLIRIMCDVLDALDHAHRNGVVHRDIKPGNILITDEGRVKVADFGVARIESSMMTQAGTRIGTPAYMSPEQHQGLAVTGRSDLFSAGVILYQLLTGGRPFTGEGYALVHQILLRDPTTPSEINIHIPRALDAVAMKALAKRPQDRFATAHEFAETLREAAAGDPVRSDVDLVLDDGILAGNDRGTLLLPGSGCATPRTATSSSSRGSNISEVLLEAELVYWKEIMGSTEPADFEIFVQVFPESPFSMLARRRLARMEEDAQSRRDADERGRQETAQQVGIESDRTLRYAEEAKVQSPDDELQGQEVKAAPAYDQAEGQREIEEGETPLLVDALVQRAGENKQAAERVRHETETPKRADPGTRKQYGIHRPLRRLDAEELMAPPGGERNDRVPALGLSAGTQRRGTKPAHTTGLPVPPHPVASHGSRKPSRLAMAAVLVAVLTGTGVWYANRPELVRIITAARTQTHAMLAQLQHQAQPREAQQFEQGRTAYKARLVEEERARDEAARLVEEERWRNEAARLVEEQPKPEEVARLVEEQRERDEVARVVEEQRREEEALTAERNQRLALARQREEAARATATQSYLRAISLLDQGRTSEAVRLLRQLAHSGHGVAAATLGDLYMSGERVLLDRQEAYHFYALAERNGIRIDRSAFVRR